MHDTRTMVLVCLISLVAVLTACGGSSARPSPTPPPTLAPPTETADVETEEPVMQITSPAFAQSESIPVKYTCDGANVSPPLAWNGVPADAKSLALISDDPDAPAGTWVHWVIYGISPSRSELSEGVEASETVLDSAVQGTNDFDNIGYGGPCPPRGDPHRYFFKLYALDTELSLGPGATKQEVLDATDGHVLAQAELMGIYKRQ